MSKHKGDRKRSAVRILALVLCILLAGSAVVAALMSVAYAEARPSTELSLTVDEANRGVHALQTTRYVNDTGVRLTAVMFSLQANALRRSLTAPVDELHIDDAYPEGFTPGGVELFRVEVDGQAAQWGVQGDAEAFVRVACALEPGASAAFTFAYDLLLPTAQGFLGTGDVGWRLSFFYPAPLHYDPFLEQFDGVAVSAVGGCLYFNEQDFYVTVDAEDGMRVASGGEATVEKGANGRAVTRIALTDARNLALALSSRYSVHERDVGGTTVSLYTRHRMSAARVLDAAQRAISVFTELLGGCPRGHFTLAETDAPGNDASHDGLIFLDTALFALWQGDALEREVVFQLAKQWFGVGVNASPSREAWLSDALGRYMTLLYDESVNGYDRYIAKLNKNSIDALNVTLPGSLTVDSYVSEMSSRSDYEVVIFGRGAAALHELRRVLTVEVLRDALKRYYQENVHGVGGIAQFAEALKQASGGRERDLLLMDVLTTVSPYAYFE